MTMDAPSSHPDEGPGSTAPGTRDPETAASETTPSGTTSATEPSAEPHTPRFTRASATWVATGVALLLLVLLIVFILQNSTKVEVHFLWMSGTIPLGMALLIAAVSGGVVVAIAGIARVTQLRLSARRIRRDASSSQARRP